MKRSKKRRKIMIKKSFILFAAAVCGGMFMIGSVSASREADTFVLTVSYGDTLWDIASENNTRNKDVRRVVDDIIRLNRLTDTAINCGDELIIPIY